jgi:hypothetical protein
VIECEVGSPEVKRVAANFQLVTADVAFVQNRVLDLALPQNVASGKVRVIELIVQGEVVRDAIEGVILDHLFQRNVVFEETRDIEIEMSQIDVNPLNNSIAQFFEFLHPSSTASVKGFQTAQQADGDSPLSGVLIYTWLQKDSFF